jgi:hypothetical protein
MIMTFNSTTESFLRSFSDKYPVTDNHVILYGKDRAAMQRVLDVVSGTNVTSTSSQTTTPYAETETCRVAVSSASTREKIVYRDVVYRRRGGALVVDGEHNRKSMDGIAAFVQGLGSWHDVRRRVINDTLSSSPSSSLRPSSVRRTVIIENAHLLTAGCQMALRGVVEKAACTSWLILLTTSLGLLERALTSRFLCLNVTPVSSPGIAARDGKNENDVKTGGGVVVDEYIEKLATKIAKAGTCSPLESIRVPRHELIASITVWAEEDRGEQASDYHPSSFPLNRAVAPFLKRLLCHLSRSVSVAHVHPEGMCDLVSSFASIEHACVLIEATMSDQMTDFDPDVSSGPPPCVSHFDDVIGKFIVQLLTCAFVETRAVMCMCTTPPPASGGDGNYVRQTIE